MFEEWRKSSGMGSHVLMDGGVLDVHPDRLNDFYTQYVQCVKQKHKIFVVEQKTPHYNFFMDIDYVDDEAINLDSIKDIALAICNKVEFLCGKGRCVISVAEPKPKNKRVKTGIHLNWNGCVVDQEQALNIREHVLNHLGIVYASIDWESIIDNSVYLGSGFRMPWSHKKSKHQSCNGTGCHVCGQSGKLVEGPYLPVFVYQEGKISDVDPYPSVDMLHEVTVRTTHEVNVQVEPLAEKQIVFKKKEGEFTKKQTKNEYNNSEIQAHIETFIRKNLRGQENARVQKIFRDSGNYLIQSNSKYCENISREHSSNHVWFLISGDKGGIITQKCFCRCETKVGRKYGFCKNFSSRPHILSKFIQDTLYPEKKKMLIENIYSHLKNKDGSKDICMSQDMGELLNLL